MALLEHHEASTPDLHETLLTPEEMAGIILADRRSFVPGEVVGQRFRIEQFLAEGGMGEVYVAEDLELGERVALKTIRPELANDERILARFKREIQLARKVTHRHVSRVFDLFFITSMCSASARTVVFLSMELLHGETLSARIRRAARCRSRRRSRSPCNWSRDSTPRITPASSIVISRAPTSSSSSRSGTDPAAPSAR